MLDQGGFVRTTTFFVAIWCSLLCCASAVLAQDQQGEAPATEASADSALSAEAQANNPLADFRAFNLQNYYIPEFSGPTEETGNNFILRYAQPFEKW
jgi:hypothetical protein